MDILIIIGTIMNFYSLLIIFLAFYFTYKIIHPWINSKYNLIVKGLLIGSLISFISYSTSYLFPDFIYKEILTNIFILFGGFFLLIYSIIISKSTEKLC